jgi:8-oxo-dGTP pyrophosphatase MutT (NUDIX family)
VSNHMVKVSDEVIEPTPSASVLLLRDPDAADVGLEVLMLERTLRSDFVGGAYVFPGGKVDAADGAIDGARWRGPDPDELAATLELDDPELALGTYVAAVRETFEESGVLLARHGDGAPVTADDLLTPDALAARAALIDRGPVADFHAWLTAEDLVLDLDVLAYWAWWVTPKGLHRRFDTRFFLAALPDEQREVAEHDSVEMTAMRWTTPADVLAAHHAEEVTVIFPTRCILTDLDAYDRPGEALAAARAGDCDRSCIEPETTHEDGVTWLFHPDGRPPEQP